MAEKMMNFEDFAMTISPIFPGEKLVPAAKFREFSAWGSLAGLSIIAMVDDDFGVLLTGNDLRSAETLGELFEIARGKQG